MGAGAMNDQIDLAAMTRPDCRTLAWNLKQDYKQYKEAKREKRIKKLEYRFESEVGKLNKVHEVFNNETKKKTDQIEHMRSALFAASDGRV